MIMKNRFYDILLSALSELDYPTDKIIVQIPKNPDHGDFTTNYPMITSNKIVKAPMEIASIIVDKINSLSEKLIESVEPIAPWIY